MANLKVLTLNCWGIPYLTKLKDERMTAIAEELSKGTHDIIILQEVWSEKDYQKLCQSLHPTMPYSHYFESGWIGSGLCVFSKGPILETFLHRFNLNGFAHKIHHGDWYAAKGAGLCKIHYQGLNINVYATHIHAQYEFKNNEDEYHAHRMCQAFELSQFVRYTGETCDVVIVAGDLNLQAHDLGYKIIRNNANLLDSWQEKKEKDEKSLGMTVEVPSNSFTNLPSTNPEGQRIDYILYRCNSGIDMECIKCCTCMSCIPDKTYNFSDHEGVAAELKVRHYATSSGTENRVNDKEKLLQEAVIVVDRGLQNVKTSQRFYGALFIMSFLALVLTGFWLPAGGLGYLVMFGRIVFSMVIAYFLVYFVVICSMEKKGLLAIKNDIQNVLRMSKILDKVK